MVQNRFFLSFPAKKVNDNKFSSQNNVQEDMNKWGMTKWWKCKFCPIISALQSELQLVLNYCLLGKENVFVKKVPTCLNSALQESLRWHARSWSLDYAFKPDLYDPLVLFVKLEFILAWTPKSSKRVGFRDMTNFSFTMYLKQKKASALGGFNFANLALELINRNYLQEYLICCQLGALNL